MSRKSHPKRCQQSWCKRAADAGPDYLFCSAHNLKAHAKHQREHPAEPGKIAYELVCLLCAMRLSIKLTEARATLLVKANAVPRCSGCGSSMVALERSDTGQIGSPWAVTCAVGIPSVFVG